MTFGRSSDRDVIQSRRALFMAAALSTLSGAARAELPKKPECKRDETASAEVKEEAKSLARDGIELSQKGLHDEAQYRLQRAFELLPHPKIAFLVAKESLIVGAPNDAIVWANAALECGLEEKDRAEAESFIASTKAASGEIELRIQTVDPGNERYIDGAEIDPNGKTLVETVKLDDVVIDPGGKIYVSPGRHSIEVRDNQYRSVELAFEISAGESKVLDIALQPALMPQVCLQPLPCLSPPPPPDPRANTRLLLDIGTLAVLDVGGDAHRNHGFAGVLALGISIPFSPETAVGGPRAYLGLEGSPGKLRSGLLFPFGGRLEAAIPSGRASVGIGIQGGWAIANGEESTDPTPRPRSGPFLEPYVPVDFWLGDRVALGARFGFFVSKQASESDESFRLGFFRTGVFLRYAFENSCEDEYDLHCRGERSSGAPGVRHW